MISRTNMVGRKEESWRPPLFTSSKRRVDRLRFGVRRYLDLQLASIWTDLSVELPKVRGAVLDVGCGAQPYRSLFGSGVQYLGIDTIDARTHFGYVVPDTKYFESSTWPLSDGSIDFILCTEVLEHVSAPLQFLEEAERCLVPGGRILITVPFSARWHYIPFDYWRFTPTGLNTLLTASGFRNVAVYARGNEITVACYKLMALILPLLMPEQCFVSLPTDKTAASLLLSSKGVRRALKVICYSCAGVLLLPLLLILAAIGNLSLRGRGGDDCLGYTSIAEK
jgi:SAM-dependent methyltransferase